MNSALHDIVFWPCTLFGENKRHDQRITLSFLGLASWAVLSLLIVGMMIGRMM